MLSLEAVVWLLTLLAQATEVAFHLGVFLVELFWDHILVEILKAVVAGRDEH